MPRKSLTVQKALNGTTTDDDTHPTPADRFRLAEKVQCKTPLPVHGTVWDLFQEREALTREMNGIIEEQVRHLRLYDGSSTASPGTVPT